MARRGGWTIALPALAVLIGGHLGYGSVRLAQNATDLRSDVVIRIVQPAIDQRDKWLGTNEDAIMALYLDGTNANTGPGNGVGGRLHPCHLAGIRLSFHFNRTARPAGADRGPLACHHHPADRCHAA